MITSIKDASRLRQLRIEYQESAGLGFPEACLTEMLILYDVCKSLELTLFQARDVLGAPAWEMVTNHINRPAAIPTERGKALVAAL
jgi:hypothetical protein